MTKIYTLVNVLGEWIVEQKPPTFTNDSLANPVASFVLDAHTGVELSPTAEALQAAMRAKPEEGKKESSPHCLWLAVSRKSMRLSINFNGERVAKVELTEEDIAEAFYLTRHGESR
jgi:syntaxin-binding protein 5